MHKWTGILASCLMIAASYAADPIIQTSFTADPAPLVYNDTVYLYTGHDEDGAGWFDMREWRVYSTTDMVNWTDLGSPMNLRTFEWANVDAWAAQCVVPISGQIPRLRRIVRQTSEELGKKVELHIHTGCRK